MLSPAIGLGAPHGLLGSGLARSNSNAASAQSFGASPRNWCRAPSGERAALGLLADRSLTKTFLVEML
jgi:hypothetical protein